MRKSTSQQAGKHAADDFGGKPFEQQAYVSEADTPGAPASGSLTPEADLPRWATRAPEGEKLESTQYADRVQHDLSFVKGTPGVPKPDPILVADNITRKFGGVTAVDVQHFEIERHGITALIGPNGAGKSSTIKILSGILTPDSGTCVIDGRVPWKDRRAHVSQIGVVFGQRSQLWWDVPVIDSFELIRDIYAVTEDVYKRNLRDLTDLLNLSELLKTPARSLSLGQRMRCEIAASLLHDPRILFLDEPTIGLDAVSKIAVREFVLDMNKRRGTTVILTTHDMQDVEALAQRVLLIGKGRILLDGTLDDIRRGGSGQIDETLAALYKQFDI